MGGPVTYSFPDFAGMLRELSGKTIQYVSPSAEIFSEQLKSNGLSVEAIQGPIPFA